MGDINILILAARQLVCLILSSTLVLAAASNFIPIIVVDSICVQYLRVVQMLRHQLVLKRLCYCLVIAAVLLACSKKNMPLDPINLSSGDNQTKEISFIPRNTTVLSPIPDIRRFVVFSCATPNDKKPYRSYDYAFYLPLTVLAWQRIGFESIVLIVGNKSEWQAHPVLLHVLDALESTNATITFLPSEIDNRIMLSQTARIFTANMDAFPGRPTDFILTSDSDLWPLRKQHFYQPEGTNRPLVLFHSNCCRPFVFNGRSYKMQPMSHVGASASTWKEMINNSNSSIVAKDSASILDRFDEIFGHQVRKRVIYATSEWFLDQKFITLAIDQWLSRQTCPQNNCVYKVSDVGLKRLNRLTWKVTMPTGMSSFAKFYDAHLPVSGFQRNQWSSIKPLLHLMYGRESPLYQFCDQYALSFYELFASTHKT